MRQTGLMLDIPALYGDIFVGRTKEGFSTSKIMVGYQGWTNERAAINDAFLPILADGIKWNGYVPSGEFVYNIGWFGDQLVGNRVLQQERHGGRGPCGVAAPRQHGRGRSASSVGGALWRRRRRILAVPLQTGSL